MTGYYTQNQHFDTLSGGGDFFTSGRWGDFSFLASGTFDYADRSGLVVPGINDIVRDSFHRLDPELYPAADGSPSPGWDPPARERWLRDSVSANDLARVGSFYGTASYGLGDSGKLKLDGNVQYFDRFGEFQDFSALTHENRVTELNWFIRLRYDLRAEEGLSLLASAALAGGGPTPDEHIVTRVGQDSHQRRKLGYLAVDAVLEASYALTKDYVFTLGLDYTNDREDLLTIEVTNEASGEKFDEQGFGERTFANLGLYAQFMMRPIEPLSITLGARGDHNNVIACDADQWDCVGSRGDEVVPGASMDGSDVTVTDRGLFQISSRAAVVYEMPVAGMYTKAMYGSSFKPPSPYQLFHRPVGVTGSIGNPALKPQTADTFEFLLGAKPHEGLHLKADFFYTSVDDIVVFFKEFGNTRGRNADVALYGLEVSASYTHKGWLSVFANATWIIDSALQPKKRPEETDFAWRNSVYNDEVPAGMFPDVLANLGLNLHLPEAHLNANLAIGYIGKRRASLINNQLHNVLSLEKTYSFDDYFLVDLTLSSVGLEFTDLGETVFSLSFRHVPGDTVEPGFGGVDIPGLGPQVVLRIAQQF